MFNFENGLRFPLPRELIPLSKVLRQEAYRCTDQTSTSPFFIYVHTQRIAACTGRKHHLVCSNGLQANGIKLFALTGVPKPHVCWCEPRILFVFTN